MPYLDCDSDELDPHYCEDCSDDIVFEKARIRKAAWVHKDAYAVLKNDVSNETIWNDQAALGKIIYLPKVTGTFDGGAAKTVPGFGDEITRISGYDCSSTIRDPVYKKNFAHYKSLSGKSAWHYAYGTETQIHLSDVPVTITPKAPITDNLDDLVVWEATITWNQRFIPAPHETPDVFNCVNPSEAPVITLQPSGGSVTIGDSIVLSVVATGSPTLTYQWKKDGVAISGATGSSYTKSGSISGDAGSYTVVVSNGVGTATSTAAVITMTAVVFDTILTFVSSTTDTDQSVTGTIAATNANTQFQFNKDTNITGLPNSMSLTLSGSEVMTVDFPGDYLGHPFRYIGSDSVVHTGTFANGTVALS